MLYTDLQRPLPTFSGWVLSQQRCPMSVTAALGGVGADRVSTESPPTPCDAKSASIKTGGNASPVYSLCPSGAPPRPFSGRYCEPDSGLAVNGAANLADYPGTPGSKWPIAPSPAPCFLDCDDLMNETREGRRQIDTLIQPGQPVFERA